MISFWEDNLPNFKYQKNWPSDSHLNPILYWLFKFLYFYQSHNTRNVKVLEHHFVIPRILRGLWISVTSPAKVFKFKRNPWRSGNELIQIGEAYPNQKPSFWLILAFQFPIIITQWWLFENDLQPLVSINTNWPFFQPLKMEVGLSGHPGVFRDPPPPNPRWVVTYHSWPSL